MRSFIVSRVRETPSASKPMQALARQLRLAGVFPGGEPVGTDVGGGVGKLADQDGAGMIVKMVVVFVGVGVQTAAGFAVSVKNGFHPTVRTEAGFESVVGGIGNECSVIRAHEEIGRVAIYQSCAEAFVHAVLRAEVAIVVIGGVERIVSAGYIVGEDGGKQFGFFPFAFAHGVGQFGA